MENFKKEKRKEKKVHPKERAKVTWKNITQLIEVNGYPGKGVSLCAGQIGHRLFFFVKFAEMCHHVIR